MNALSFCRYALAGIAAAILAGCGAGGGSNASGAVPALPGAAPDAFNHHKTFHYSGSRQSFIVPSGVKRLKIVARGGEGAGPGSIPGGRPGLVDAIISVTPGHTLYVFVGGRGTLSGGYNGGGNGGSSHGCNCKGYGGGGASDVREGGYELKDRILVAGGGGGTGGGGGGGTQSKGGAGGSAGSGSDGNGVAGSSGVGGDGGRGSGSYSNGAGGGGGGGGFYGGGGGGVGAGSGSSSGDAEAGGGGGGGSSWIELGAIKYRFWRGWKTTNPDGIVVFSWGA